MLRFQECVLRQDLDRLPPRSRAAFAACCAQRLYDVGRRFLVKDGLAARADFYHAAIECAWNHILVSPDKARIARLLPEVMALIPDEDAPGWTQVDAYGGDALSALAYCLRCMQSGDAQEAAWAAQCIYESLDYYVNSVNEISPNEPAAEIVILENPAIQAELERQTRDLADLSSAGDLLSQDLLDNLRKRSTTQQAIPA